MEVMVRHNVFLTVTKWRWAVGRKTRVHVGSERTSDVKRASRGISWWMVEPEPCF